MKVLALYKQGTLKSVIILIFMKALTLVLIATAVVVAIAAVIAAIYFIVGEDEEDEAP